MYKCERCGLEGDSTQIKRFPDKNTYWINKPICKKCYLEIKKIEENKISKDKSTFKGSPEKIIKGRLRKKINEKPIIIYILVTMWIVIGVSTIGIVAHRTSTFWDYIESLDRVNMPDNITNAMTFNYVFFIILFTIIIIISFLLAYSSFMKKSYSWLIGLMFSSFLIYFVIQVISSIGLFVIYGKFDVLFNNLEYIVYIFMLFIVPIVIFIHTRPKVNLYFGKT